MARHEYACSIRWSDMDAFGHVNNVSFLRYLEEARVDFISSHMWRDGRSEDDGVAVVARQGISYVRPLRYRSAPITIEMWVSELDHRAFTFAYEIKDTAGDVGPSNVLYARADTVMVPYDLSVGRRRPFSATETGLYSKYLDLGRLASQPA